MARSTKRIEKRLAKAVSKGDMEAITSHGRELGLSEAQIKGLHSNSVQLQRRYGTLGRRIGRALKIGAIASLPLAGFGALAAHQQPAFMAHHEETRTQMAQDAHDRMIEHQQGRLNIRTEDLNRELDKLGMFDYKEKKAIKAKHSPLIKAERVELMKLKDGRSVFIERYPHEIKDKANVIVRSAKTYNPQISPTNMSGKNLKHGALGGAGLGLFLGARTLTARKRKAKKKVRKIAKQSRRKNRKK